MDDSCVCLGSRMWDYRWVLVSDGSLAHNDPPHRPDHSRLISTDVRTLWLLGPGADPVCDLGSGSRPSSVTVFLAKRKNKIRDNWRGFF